ncbi:MAG: MOSC domain-containing protein [Gluconacetobacter diazotrophicus]|nr:MOSC domain-containing protein [Gluconacetobacter diazotrophicus]
MTDGAAVAGLRIYPVKGLRGIPVEEARVGRLGLDGDRRWMVVTPDGRFVTQRQNGRMALVDALPAPDGGLRLRLDGEEQAVERPGADGERMAVTVWGSTVAAVAAGAEADRWLSAALEQPCRLVFMADERARKVEAGYDAGDDHVSFADGFPLLATGTGSLAALNAALAANGGTAVPMDRFRPNLVMEGVPAWHEDGWGGMRAGTTRFRVAKPCSRCVVVTRDQRTGTVPHPGEPLRTLGRLNRTAAGIMFGINLIPDGEGVIRVGDVVVPEGGAAAGPA